MAEPSQFNVDRTRPGLCTVTFSNPPINMFGPSTIEELSALVKELEADPSVKVVVFQSANADFFIAHFDVGNAAQRPAVLGLWRELCFDPHAVVSIAKIRGRTRGIGDDSSSPAACALPAGRRRSSANPDGFDWCPAAVRWSGFRAWSAARGPWKLCSAATTSMQTSPSATAG